MKNIIEKSDKQLVKILREILHIQIDKINVEKQLRLKNISEYEFEVIKTKAQLEDGNELEIYFKPIVDLINYFLDLANVDSSYRFEIVENYFSIKE